MEKQKEKLKEELGVEGIWDKKTTQSTFQGDGYSVYFTLSSYWSGGYNASIKIENTGNTTIENWNLGFNYLGKISNIWNASLQSQTDTAVKIKNAGWNQDIPAGGSVEFGMSGQEDFKGFPTSYQLLGTRTQENETNYDIVYHLDSDWGSGFTGTITITNKTNEVIEDWRLSFQFDRKITNIWNASIESQDGSNYTIANVGYNSSIAAGQSISFGFNGTDGTKDQIPSEYKLYTYKENEEVDNSVDSDQDGLLDNLEDRLGTDKYKADTDSDGLSDYIEKVVLGLDPLLKDTDGNGVDDGDEDGDNDGLSNIKEIELGTNLLLDDSDDDGLKDGEEVHTYGTSPITLDTDEDGVSDGKEVELGTNPLVYESSFDVNVASNEEDTVKASVDITLSGNQVETLSVEKVDSEFLFPTTMPGYVGGAYDFTVDGTFESATLNFTFDEALLKDQGFEPVIYYFNEETQLLEALETEVNGNVASARTTHFSKYILLNRKVYEDSFEWQDVWDTSGYKNVEVVLVIDDSGSMSWNDSSNQRLSVSKQLIDKLPQNNKAGIVKFTTSTYLLTDPITSDKDYAKSFLTTSYFRSNGGTSMYQAINKAFALFEANNEDTLKMMIVLSDGETSDTSLHKSVVQKANDNKIKIFTVGLGSSSSYFTRYLKPLADNTAGAFYLASNANELNDIYKDINEKIDIETDSDSDGIPDYYEDNMVMFNGVKIKLDKNNPDTDGDGLDDGEEVAELNYQYNADKTKVIVTGKLLSNPLEGDTDGDLDSDLIDPSPFEYQLNDLLCHNIVKLNDLAIEYSKNKKYNSSEFETSVESWLTFMFIRQFNSGYTTPDWDSTGKSIDYSFVSYVAEKDKELHNYFKNTSDFYANSKGEIGDLYHLAATLTGYVYNSNFSDGIAFGIMPEYHINNLSGWAGDLQTAMNDAIAIAGKNANYDLFKKVMLNLIGYDANVNDIYSGNNHSFDIDDVYADTDAYNIYKLLRVKKLKKSLDNYFKKDYLKRFSIFTNNYNENTIKEIVFVYTKKYLGAVTWPLHKNNQFSLKQSEAARDAFTEYLIERIKDE